MFLIVLNNAWLNTFIGVCALILIIIGGPPFTKRDAKGLRRWWRIPVLLIVTGFGIWFQSLKNEISNSKSETIGTQRDTIQTNRFKLILFLRPLIAWQIQLITLGGNTKIEGKWNRNDPLWTCALEELLTNFSTTVHSI